MNSSVQPTPPLVSICIPTHNRAGYLELCLRSALQQDYSPIEVVVCDNASTDGTGERVAAVAAEFPHIPVNYHRNELNLGMVPNWNRALTAASGEWGIVLSDDDIMEPNAISVLVSTATTINAEFVYSTVRFIDPEGRAGACSRPGPKCESTDKFIRRTIGILREPYPSALLFRMCSARRIGGFPEISNRADIAFRLSLAKAAGDGMVACVMDPLVQYRVHPQSLTANRRMAGTSALLFSTWAIGYFADHPHILRRLVYQFLHVRESLQVSQEPAVRAACVEESRRVAQLVSGLNLGFRWIWAVQRPRGRAAVLFTFPILTLIRVGQILARWWQQR